MVEGSDVFGLADEFAVDPKGSPAEDKSKAEAKAVGGPAPKFRQDIDLKDGSGVQVFEADTAEGLVAKLATAQEHATRELRKLQRAAKVKPERPGTRKPATALAQIAAMTVEEEAAFAESFQQTPGAAFRNLMKRVTGLSPEDFQQLRANTDQILATQKEGDEANQFLIDHQDSYYPTAGNYRKLVGVLNAEDLPLTAQNLRYAYQQVESELDPLPGETKAPKPDAQPAPVATAQANKTEVKPQRTGITGGEPAPEVGAGQPKVNADLFTGTLNEQRDKISRELHRRRTAAS